MANIPKLQDLHCNKASYFLLNALYQLVVIETDKLNGDINLYKNNNYEPQQWFIIGIDQKFDKNAQKIIKTTLMTFDSS